eukprot:SAG11_NODE_8976_length_957_cov_1.389277_2_plen_118_part_01
MHRIAIAPRATRTIISRVHCVARHIAANTEPTASRPLSLVFCALTIAKMAAARLVVGVFVALLCVGVVMSAAPAQQLATWLEKSAGLSGKKMSTALALCEAKEFFNNTATTEIYTKGL